MIAWSRRGSLMVMTLWIIAILGILAVAIGRQLALQVRITRYRQARADAQALARGGIALAMERLMLDAQRADEPYDWLGETWAAGPIGSEGGGVWSIGVPKSADDPANIIARVEIRITDEDGKLGLNSLENPVVYESFIRLLGASDQIDLIADYVDADSEPRPAGLEELEAVAPYRAKNGPLAALYEIGVIPGIRPETLLDLSPHASVFIPAETLININTAPGAVLVAAGLTTLAEAIVSFREQGHYFTVLSPEVVTDSPAVPPPFDPGETEFQNVLDRLGVTSQTFTVVSEATTADPEVRVRVEAVLRRTGCGDGMSEPCIVSWNEQ